MNDPAQRYTKTLAKLYADQGHFDKAIEIYQHLVKKFPEREDILDDFSDLKIKMQNGWPIQQMLPHQKKNRAANVRDCSFVFPWMR